MRRRMCEVAVTRWNALEPLWTTVVGLSAALHAALGVALYLTPASPQPLAADPDRRATLIELRWPEPRLAPRTPPPRARQPERTAHLPRPALAPARRPRHDSPTATRPGAGLSRTTTPLPAPPLVDHGGLTRETAAVPVSSRLPARPLPSIDPGTLPSLAIAAPAAATGCITASDIEPRMARLHHEARRCYERRLAHRSGLAGTVVTTILIDEEGVVRHARVGGGTLTDPAVGACLLDLLAAEQFPACDGGVAEITQPWTFRPRR